MIIFKPQLAQKIGIEAALLYGALEEIGAVNEPQFTNHEDMQQRTTLSKYQIRKALAALKTAGLLETKLVGTPPQRRVELKEVQTA
jgi:hypothetical protein